MFIDRDKIMKHYSFILTKTSLVATGFFLFITLSILLSAFEAQASADNNGIEFGYQLRIRYEDFDNIITYNNDLDDQQQFFRFRSRLWGQWIRNNLKAKLQVTNEFRQYQHPDRSFTFDELFVDELYLQIDDLFESGWFLKAGRQIIIKGDGFIFFDGMPLDGSRAIHYNALIAGIRTDSFAVEFLGISNPHEDKYLPRLNNKDRRMSERDELAVGTWTKALLTSDIALEGIWLYKQEKTPDSSDATDGLKRVFHTLSARSVIPFSNNSSLTSEIAAQIGSDDHDKSIRAWGGYAVLKHSLKTAMAPVISVSAGALSGNNPKTDTDEGWTPPFSRWPLWSELYIYSFIHERGVASWSNMWYANAQCVLHPAEPVKLRLAYYKLGAFYAPETQNDKFGAGTNRGDLFQFMTEFKLPAGFTGHVLYEHLIPGDFYSARDSGHYLRLELIWQFARRLNVLKSI
jgi:hypothetical protein